ncbi:hypothetical protein HK101_002149, partial [Irineochytrium annulatum]
MFGRLAGGLPTRGEAVTFSVVAVLLALVAVVHTRRRQRVAAGLKNLRGKVVIITGSSKGIGEELAYLYATHGAIPVLASRSLPALQAIADRCKALGAPRAHAIALDASSVESCRSLIETTIRLEGRLDVLVLNHTRALYAPLLAPREGWEGDEGDYGKGEREEELRE